MVVIEIIAMLAFTIMAGMWVLGVPISLIVIAVKLSYIHEDICEIIEAKVVTPAWDYKKQMSEANFRKNMVLGKEG